MVISTREANVRALMGQVSRHKLFEHANQPHVVKLSDCTGNMSMSVTCSCTRNWYLLASDIEPTLRLLFEQKQEGRLVALLNGGVGTLRWVLARYAPSLLEVKHPSRYDRSPPV